MTKQPRRASRPLLPDFEEPCDLAVDKYLVSASQEIQDACTQLCLSPLPVQLEPVDISMVDDSLEHEVEDQHGTNVTGSDVMRRLIQNLTDRAGVSQVSLDSNSDQTGMDLLMSSKKRKRVNKSGLAAKFNKAVKEHQSDLNLRPHMRVRSANEDIQMRLKIVGGVKNNTELECTTDDNQKVRVFFNDAISADRISGRFMVIQPPFQTFQDEKSLLNGKVKYIFGVEKYAFEPNDCNSTNNDAEEEECILFSWKCKCVNE